MEEYDLGIGVNVTQEELFNILYAYANSTPYLNVLEEVELFLAGYKTELSETLLKEFQRDKEEIIFQIERMRARKNAY